MRGGPAALLWTLASVGSVVLAASSAAESDRVHVVRPGETLWQIAAGLTGDPRRWPELYRANRDQIKDPSTLYPGQRLAIPDFDAAAPPEPLAPVGSRPREGDAEPSGSP